MGVFSIYCDSSQRTNFLGEKEIMSNLNKPILKLSSLVDEMDCQHDEIEIHYCLSEGIFYHLGEELLCGEGDDALLEQRFEAEPENFIAIPSNYDIHEYRMMEGFILQLEDEEKERLLEDALRGRGAFRRFKGIAHDLGVIDDWYDYRKECYRAVAVHWCDTHGIKSS